MTDLNVPTNEQILFSPGRIVATPGVLDSVSSVAILSAICRHLQGDWGLVCEDDRTANDEALAEGFRLLSVYETADGTRFWIITEADRSATTVLLPSEY